jgi:hypothetical protein
MPFFFIIYIFIPFLTTNFLKHGKGYYWGCSLAAIRRLNVHFMKVALGFGGKRQNSTPKLPHILCAIFCRQVALAVVYASWLSATLYTQSNGWTDS